MADSVYEDDFLDLDDDSLYRLEHLVAELLRTKEAPYSGGQSYDLISQERL